MTLSKEQVQELLPGYVLGALDSQEMLAIDEYLAQHRELLQQVRSAEDAVALMALAATPERPPAAVRQKLMQRVAADAAERPLPAAGALPSPAQTARISRMPRQWPTFVRNVVAVSAATALVALAVYSALLGRHIATLQQQADARTQTIAEMEGQNAGLLSALEAINAEMATLKEERNQLASSNSLLQTEKARLDVRLQEIDQKLAADESRLQLLSTANDAVMLTGGEDAPQSRGAFYVSGPQGVLVIHGLKPLPENQVYQFWWVTDDGTQLPITPVEVQANVEPIWAVFDVPQQAAPYTVVGLSIEPASGSPQPTGPMILEGAKTG